MWKRQWTNDVGRNVVMGNVGTPVVQRWCNDHLQRVVVVNTNVHRLGWVRKGGGGGGGVDAATDDRARR